MMRDLDITRNDGPGEDTPAEIAKLAKGATAPEAREVIHLTETGFNAGRRFCTADRADGQRNVHGAYAPLHNEAFREKVCLDCLNVWANEAYEDGDTMPDYIADLRKHGKAGQSDEPAPEQLQLVMQ